MNPPILAHIESLGYAVFTSGDYNLNLFGIRSKDLSAGSYNDLMGCIYKVNGQWVSHYWAATTDPGVYYRENPINVLGTAILVPGQYRNVYKLGTHRGYEALTQQNGEVTVWRDDNKDDQLDVGPGVDLDSGYFGINLHASSSDPYNADRDNDPSAQVGKHSAGCQVHATTTGFREMMSIAKLQIQHRGWTTFTYTLLDQWW